ncbi:hypothetical protein RFI_22231, partial [Reticulomyxa filosa]
MLLGIDVFGMSYYWLYVAILPMGIFRHVQTTVRSVLASDSKNGNENTNANANASVNEDENVNVNLKKNVKESRNKDNGNRMLNKMAKWSLACYVGRMIGPLLTSSTSNIVSLSCLMCLTLYVLGLGVVTVHTNAIENTNTNTNPKTKSKTNVRKKDASVWQWDTMSWIRPTLQKSAELGLQKWLIYHSICYFALQLFRSSFPLIIQHKFGQFNLTSFGYLFSYRAWIGLVITWYLSTYRQRIKNNNSNSNAPTATSSSSPSSSPLSSSIGQDTQIRHPQLEKNNVNYQLLLRANLLLGVSMLGFALSYKLSQLVIVVFLQECAEAIFRTSFYALFAQQ